MRERKKLIIAAATVCLGILFILGLIYGMDVIEFLEDSVSQDMAQLVYNLLLLPAFLGIVFGIMYLWGIEFKKKS